MGVDKCHVVIGELTMKSSLDDLCLGSAGFLGGAGRGPEGVARPETSCPGISPSRGFHGGREGLLDC